MSEPRLSWPRRFLDAAPAMPDWFWAGWFLVLVFACGVITGMALCVEQSAREVRRLSIQQQLDSMDLRLRTFLEQQRQRQETAP